MADYLRRVFKIKTTWVLMTISIFSILLSISRVVFTEKSMFLFMLWNLFLAFIPWFLASVLYIKNIKNRFAIVLLIVSWLAFFPNAPYVLTDIIHLGNERSAPIWFDLILLLSYGFTGLLYGFVSLRMIEKIVSARTGFRKEWLISVFLIYLSCFGIYLGRFLRWNSWDLVINLDDVMKDILIRIISPFDHPVTWVFTALFGTLLNLLFWSYKSFSGKEETGK